MGKSLVLRLSAGAAGDSSSPPATEAQARRRARQLQRDLAVLAKFVGV